MVSFFSDATLEDISATNAKATSLYNLGSQEIVFSVPIREFEFRKSLMREHFNDKYMESDKFPTATFVGKIRGVSVNATSVQDATATGTLTIHGVHKAVEIAGTVQISRNQLVLKSKFTVRLDDYGVKIPTLLWQNIAEEVLVTVDFVYTEIKKD